MIAHARWLRGAAALAAGLGVASFAAAGPPLICHPFTTGSDAPLLPWAEGNRWHSPDPAYDRGNLVADTLSLLSTDAPILVRMENMRRAAIYADENPSMAAELLSAVVERTRSKPDDARAEALEWFDAGYLVETYRRLRARAEGRCARAGSARGARLCVGFDGARAVDDDASAARGLQRCGWLVARTKPAALRRPLSRGPTRRRLAWMLLLEWQNHSRRETCQRDRRVGFI